MNEASSFELPDKAPIGHGHGQKRLGGGLPNRPVTVAEKPHQRGDQDDAQKMSIPGTAGADEAGYGGEDGGLGLEAVEAEELEEAREETLEVGGGGSGSGEDSTAAARQRAPPSWRFAVEEEGIGEWVEEGGGEGGAGDGGGECGDSFDAG